MTTVEKIDAILRDRKMSRRKLAICANIPTSTLQSAMERNGDMSFEMREKIANVLGIHISQLLGDDERKIYFSGEFFGGLDEFVKYRESGYEFTDEEIAVVKLYNSLNSVGRQKAVERVEELTEIPRYRHQESPQSPPAPTEGKDTTPPPAAPETASEGK